MSDTDRDGPAADARSTSGSAAPFLGALVIIVIVITAIFVLNRGGGDDNAEQIGTAVSAQNAALQRNDYSAFVAHTCAAQRGTEDEVRARQRDSVAAKGERYVNGVGNVLVDGDKAHAEVVYHFNNAPDAVVRVTMGFVREDGAWRVCTAGPS